jgi:NAD-dependent deacetylase
MEEYQPEKAAEIFLTQLKESNKAVALTGAGVSTASGIPDFRSPGGLYSKVSQRTFQQEFFYSAPEEYYKIASEYIHPLNEKPANVTHKMLAELEKQGLIEAVITQNIDGLHQKAGSENVIEFHGNIKNFTCTTCGSKFEKDEVDCKLKESEVPRCECNAIIRPDIVFFGDPIPIDALNSARKLTSCCDLFLTMGTSLSVQPAGSLPVIALQGGAKVFIVNRDSTMFDSESTYCFQISLEDFSRCVLNQIKL